MPNPSRTHGLTLIEVLVALVVIGLIGAVIAATVPRANRAGSDAVTLADAAVSVEQLTNALQRDFKQRGTFRGFSEATTANFTGVFTQGSGFTPQVSTDFAQQTSFTVPGLNASVGELVYLTGRNNQAKLLRVSAKSGDTYEHADCRNGISGLGARVFRANTLSVLASGTDTYRAENLNGWTVAAQGTALNFGYAYRQSDGTLAENANGTAPVTGSATRSGVYVGARATANSDVRATQNRRIMLDLPATSTATLLDCGAGIAAPTGTNRLRVTVTLPSGLGSGNVTTIGPSVNTTFGATTTLAGLGAGTYTVTAQTVTNGVYTYAPDVRGAPVTITGRNQTSYAQVIYTATTGQLNVTVTGLPASVQGVIRTTGPSNTVYSSPNGTFSLNNLPPGNYTLRGDDVVYGGATYKSAVSYAAVSAGQSRSVTVTYTPVAMSGTVNVTINGASASSLTASSSPAAFSIAVTPGTQTRSNIAPGTYVLALPDLPQAGDVYLTPRPQQRTFTVTAGGVTNISFTYEEYGDPVDDSTTGGSTTTTTGSSSTTGSTTTGSTTGDTSTTGDDDGGSGGGGGGGGRPACYWDGGNNEPVCGF